MLSPETEVAPVSTNFGIDSQKLLGAEELEAREVLQWSVIQHYEVGQTPLLDLTHSLAVACSFAQDGRDGDDALVYVFVLPHIANRISVNSEHELINIRLLSICPPDALRPFFQESYLAGTWDVTDKYADKRTLDFNRRLLAKFTIPNGRRFWGRGFGPIPRELLYPRRDKVSGLCEQIISASDVAAGADSIGNLLLAWQRIEHALLSAASGKTRRMTNARRAIDILRRDRTIPQGLANEIDYVRKWRNQLVHGLEPVSDPEARDLLRVAQSLADTLEDILEQQRNRAEHPD